MRVASVTTKLVNLAQLSSELGNAPVGGPNTDTCMTNASKTIWAEVASQAVLDSAITAHVANGAWGLPLKFSFTINSIPTAIWTNQPAALTELPNSRFNIPLFGCNYARFCTNVAVAGFTGAILMVRLSLDNGASWTAVNSSPQIVIDSTGFKKSSLVAIPANFQIEVLGAIWGQGGNATADPSFGLSMVGTF